MSHNMQGSPDAKKPCKGILKTSSSFDKHSATASHRKSAKFDELNVLQTYHPPDKDYGHMKIEEPKTPYNYTIPDTSEFDPLDPTLLAEKLRVAADTTTIYPSTNSDESSEEEETDEQKARRIEFEKRRKAHYKEFEAVKLARKLIEEEDDEDEDDKSSNKPSVDVINESDKERMEVEETTGKEDAQNTSPSSDG